jgi:hypothetical protein
MRCGIRCPYWHFTLRFPPRQGPICKKYMLDLHDARDKCFHVSGPGRARKRRVKPVKPIATKPWPGMRGWGPITMQIKQEGV